MIQSIYILYVLIQVVGGNHGLAQSLLVQLLLLTRKVDNLVRLVPKKFAFSGQRHKYSKYRIWGLVFNTFLKPSRNFSLPPATPRAGPARELTGGIFATHRVSLPINWFVQSVHNFTVDHEGQPRPGEDKKIQKLSCFTDHCSGVLSPIPKVIHLLF